MFRQRLQIRTFLNIYFQRTLPVLFSSLCVNRWFRWSGQWFVILCVFLLSAKSSRNTVCRLKKLSAVDTGQLLFYILSHLDKGIKLLIFNGHVLYTSKRICWYIEAFSFQKGRLLLYVKQLWEYCFTYTKIILEQKWQRNAFLSLLKLILGRAFYFSQKSPFLFVNSFFSFFYDCKVGVESSFLVIDIMIVV